jgi:DNA-directed RNA polymerase specialized sigma24 family protein
LAGFESVGEVVRAAWADPPQASAVLDELAVLSARDELAAQASVAVLAPRLLAVVGRWASAGVSHADLEDMAGELVVAALVALRERPGPRTPGSIVDAAWGRVRSERRKERRSGARLVPLEPMAPQVAPAAREQTTAKAAALVVNAYRSGRLSLPAAQAVWATGVAGWPADAAAARLGCRPEALRARRSRAIRALAA